jgi:hypothetical protein
MTRLEREDLQRLARYREKILKSAARQRSAELMANFEQQLARVLPDSNHQHGGANGQSES